MYKLNIDILHRKKLHSYLPSIVVQSIQWQNRSCMKTCNLFWKFKWAPSQSQKKATNSERWRSYNIFVILNSNMHTEYTNDLAVVAEWFSRHLNMQFLDASLRTITRYPSGIVGSNLTDHLFFYLIACTADF